MLSRPYELFVLLYETWTQYHQHVWATLLCGLSSTILCGSQFAQRYLSTKHSFVFFLYSQHCYACSCVLSSMASSVEPMPRAHRSPLPQSGLFTLRIATLLCLCFLHADYAQAEWDMERFAFVNETIRQHGVARRAVQTAWTWHGDDRVCLSAGVHGLVNKEASGADNKYLYKADGEALTAFMQAGVPIYSAIQVCTPVHTRSYLMWERFVHYDTGGQQRDTETAVCEYCASLSNCSHLDYHVFSSVSTDWPSDFINYYFKKAQNIAT